VSLWLVFRFIYDWAKFHYAECGYAKCGYTECRGAIFDGIIYTKFLNLQKKADSNRVL
jgi:hypothetical protein